MEFGFQRCCRERSKRFRRFSVSTLREGGSLAFSFGRDISTTRSHLRPLFQPGVPFHTAVFLKGMNLPAKYSRRSLQPFQHNDLSPAICPCERFLHGCPTERAEPPHDVLHHPGSLLVDEPHRQQQYGLVAGILYVTQPPQELRAFGRDALLRQSAPS